MYKLLTKLSYVCFLLLMFSLIQGVVDQRYLQAIASVLSYFTFGLLTVINGKGHHNV